MLGATLLGDVCGQLEAAGAAGDLPKLTSNMGRFETELLRLNGYLEMFPGISVKRG